MKRLAVLVVAACGASQRATATLACGDLHCSGREICVTTELSWAIRETYPTIPQYECRVETEPVHGHKMANGLVMFDVHTAMLDLDCIMADARHEYCSVEAPAMGPDEVCREHGHRARC